MSEYILPPKLNINDKVLIISPSSRIDKKLVNGLKERLISWGLRPIQGKYSTAKAGEFAGTIKQRLSDLQYGIDKKDIKAIFCTRGGYGMLQLIDLLDLSPLIKRPKWIIGYSDITYLHTILIDKSICSLHAPMARQFSLAPKEDLSIELTRKILFGDSTEYIVKTGQYYNKGECKGRLVGGNLTALQSMLGSKYEFIKEEIILFLEDINISHNQVERLLYSFKQYNIFKRVKGLIFGRFHFDFLDEKEINKIDIRLNFLLKRLKIPVAYNFPIGHGPLNYPLINGAFAELKVERGITKLIF